MYPKIAHLLMSDPPDPEIEALTDGLDDLLLMCQEHRDLLPIEVLVELADVGRMLEELERQRRVAEAVGFDARFGGGVDDGD